MAPPSSRRPGFSRRAQLGLFAGYVIALAGILAGLGLVLVARFDPPGFALLRGAALDLTAPITGAARGAVTGIAGVGERAGAWWNAGAQNVELRRELAQARRALLAARVAEAQNRRLVRLARLVARAPERIATARILGSTASQSRQFATIDVGRADGVRPGMPVRSSEGLVGRVFEAGQTAARVTMLTDGGSVVPVRLLRDGSPALAAGRGDGLIEIRPLSAGLNPFRRGDVVITSGTGGIFWADVPVALVIEVQDDVAVARPLADPARLDYVIVERAALPPVPSPPPAPAAAAAQP